MGDLYLEVYFIEEDKVKAPVQSVICLLTLHYLGAQTFTRVHFVLNEKSSQRTVILRLDRLTYDVVVQIPPPASFCALPVFNCDDSISCVAGFCAVLRQIVKCSGSQWLNLLGFREACLVACAEVSIWTKFCEVDLISAAKNVLQETPKSDKLPIEMARLEQHLAQPVRVHNIDKFKNKEHKYVEGPNFLLTDLLVTISTYIILEKLQSWDENILPLTIKWIKNIIDHHNFRKELELLEFEKLPSGRTWKLLPVPKESLYKRDPTRYKPRNKIFTQQSDIELSMEIISSIEMMVYKDPLGHDLCLGDNIPKPDVPANRLERKIQQLENLVKSTLLVADKGDIIVDFCSGSGHLGLILAHCLPEATVILLDNKEKSLDRAKERLKELNNNNIYVIQANLDYYTGKFQVGVSLHACGSATDLVIQKCLQNKANIVICPCCYGGIQKNHIVNYPQSEEYKSTGLDERGYIVLGHCADQAGTEQGEEGMRIVDTDRCLLAMNRGYKVNLSKLVPITCTTRNNLIVATINHPVQT